MHCEFKIAALLLKRTIVIAFVITPTSGATIIQIQIQIQKLYFTTLKNLIRDTNN